MLECGSPHTTEGTLHSKRSLQNFGLAWGDQVPQGTCITGMSRWSIEEPLKGIKWSGPR